jgi:hypothetical protein
MGKKKKAGSSQKLNLIERIVKERRKKKPVDFTKLSEMPEEGSGKLPKTAAASSRPKRTQPPKPPRYIVDPVWHTSTNDGGGTKMVVTIGPTGSQTTNYGSVPKGNTPSVMKDLLEKHGEYGWVAGHLLNDNLGGAGIAQNLTPLTTAGNKNHLNACETLIKNTIDKAYSRIEFAPNDKYWYGVYYEVQVSAVKHGNKHPWDKVATHLLVSAKVVRQNKQSLEVTDLAAANDVGNIYFQPFTNRTVENTLLELDE